MNASALAEKILLLLPILANPKASSFGTLERPQSRANLTLMSILTLIEHGDTYSYVFCRHAKGTHEMTQNDPRLIFFSILAVPYFENHTPYRRSLRSFVLLPLLEKSASHPLELILIF